VIAGRGYGIADCKPSIELVHGLDALPAIPGGDEAHPLLGAMVASRMNTAVAAESRG